MNTIIDYVLFTLVICGLLSLVVYAILTDIDERENYETYLVQINGKTYLAVKERQNEETQKG